MGGERKALRPPGCAIARNDESFIAVERLDQGQAGRADDRDGRGERVGEAKVWSGHARGGDARSRPTRMRVLVLAAVTGMDG